MGGKQATRNGSKPAMKAYEPMEEVHLGMIPSVHPILNIKNLKQEGERYVDLLLQKLENTET